MADQKLAVKLKGDGRLRLPRPKCEDHVVVLDDGDVHTVCSRCGAELPFVFSDTWTIADLKRRAEDEGVEIEVGMWYVPRPCFTCAGKRVMLVEDGGYIACPDCDDGRRLTPEPGKDEEENHDSEG